MAPRHGIICNFPPFDYHLMANPKPPKSAAERQFALNERRNLKMARSAHAYVRGSTVHFYEWLGGKGVSKSVPHGPPIWICGDCHTGNLGPVADVEGNVAIQIRDLDQTVVGNPAHDLLRLGLSLAMAARSSDLPGVTTALMIEALIDSYTGVLAGRRSRAKTENIAPVHQVFRCALQRKWRHLAQERIKNGSPHIPLGQRFWPLSGKERADLSAMLEGKEEREFLSRLTDGNCKESPIVRDAAFWVKGCSSLGRLRYAVLVETGKRYRLLDVKEAAGAAAPRAKDGLTPANNGERVVMGARHLSPFLGERMIATSFAGRQVFFVRELRPQDLKFELSGIGPTEAVLTARLFAEVVGRAHARQMSREDRRNWFRELRKGHSKNLEAPSWLWNAVVDLVTEHESAYLRHCRRFALSQEK